MEQDQDTGELLAIKFPYSHHLIPQFEQACEEVATKGRGWGRLMIDSQGLNQCGKLLVKFFDVQRRMFFSKEKPEK